MYKSEIMLKIRYFKAKKDWKFDISKPNKAENSIFQNQTRLEIRYFKAEQGWKSIF